MNEPISRAELTEALNRELLTLKEDLHSIRRTLVGAPGEGNSGMLSRMLTVERRVAILIWTIPVWVTAGTGLGNYLVSMWTP